MIPHALPAMIQPEAGCRKNACKHFHHQRQTITLVSSDRYPESCGQIGGIRGRPAKSV